MRSSRIALVRTKWTLHTFCHILVPALLCAAPSFVLPSLLFITHTHTQAVTQPSQRTCRGIDPPPSQSFGPAACLLSMPSPAEGPKPFNGGGACMCVCVCGTSTSRFFLNHCSSTLITHSSTLICHFHHVIPMSRCVHRAPARKNVRVCAVCTHSLVTHNHRYKYSVQCLWNKWFYTHMTDHQKCPTCMHAQLFKCIAASLFQAGTPVV